MVAVTCLASTRPVTGSAARTVSPVVIRSMGLLVPSAIRTRASGTKLLQPGAARPPALLLPPPAAFPPLPLPVALLLPPLVVLPPPALPEPGAGPALPPLLPVAPARGREGEEGMDLEAPRAAPLPRSMA